MGLVDHGLVIVVARRPVVAPVEERVGDHRQHRVAPVVHRVELVGLGEPVAEQRLVGVDLPVDRLRIRVEEQLRRVAAVPFGRVVRPVNAVAVALARLDRGQVGMPDEAVHLRQLNKLLRAVIGDQRQVDLFGNLREQREVRTGTVVRGSEGIGTSRPFLHSTTVPIPTP
jgi:hypothetical protein